MKPLSTRIRDALHDNDLRAAVLNSCRHSLSSRSRVIAGVGDYDGARDKAREIRSRALDRLDELLSRFAERFTAAGGRVHFAADAADACRIALELLRRRGARKGVKSKSMVSEEVELGKALAAAGVDAVESDLGEFIVQLAGEPPSHITAPALHRSRASIGELFRDRLGETYTDDPAQLTRIARRRLRERFLDAEFGISGANFIIAETGHLCIVENESNVRLGLSLPNLYIAITGIEKVVESLGDLPPLLGLLPRSATGQRTTAYTHLLRPGAAGEDGPGEMHIILVDNGRQRALADPVMREMLLCIRCGACLNVCPVYQTVGGHAYGSVYPGPMGAVYTNLLGAEPLQQPALAQLSTLCGACRDICPLRIDIPKLLLELRDRSPKTPLERTAAIGWNWMMATPQRLQIAGRLGRAGGGLLPGNWFRRVPRSFRDERGTVTGTNGEGEESSKND